MLCLDAQNEKVTPISYSHMMLIWRKQLTHIKIPKKSRFSQCDVCMKLKDKLATCQDKTQREELIQKRKKHLEQQNAERQKYYKHISKAKFTPSKYVSIILDAMDQEKTSIPKMYETPKSLGNIWKVKINLMGAIVHGYGLYGFFDSFQWSHGAAYTISILVQVLLLLDNIPDTLYIQLDNCLGQNKNRYVLGFLAKLVEENIFKKVKLSFLMVGHTHEDIDQLFSRYKDK
ncbi:uncharacterized protein LOC123524917 isoform X2 [Mercenaria mercenaria]|uniref:uncharacterized protein LOC123524917 isoform X2 n=1 Tax=Mercenaria mercenaria TaxID=6596 RepID=UPI00234E3A03|nr:uncharacterized protein LOC123524917 isoform X2 [Mercenaria mercenaria]